MGVFGIIEASGRSVRPRGEGIRHDVIRRENLRERQVVLDDVSDQLQGCTRGTVLDRILPASVPPIILGKFVPAIERSPGHLPIGIGQVDEIALVAVKSVVKVPIGQ